MSGRGEEQQDSDQHSPKDRRIKVIEGRNETLDQRWDDFVASHPQGELVQSTLWADLKTRVGWNSLRVEITDDDQLVGGGQMLTRRIPVLGRFAYVPKGPLVSTSELGPVILEEFLSLARVERIHHLTMQPPAPCPFMEQALTGHSFSTCGVPVAPDATLLIDLSPSEDELLAAMKRMTRNNIRVGLREGVTCRVGGRADIGRFHEMLVATGERRRFRPHHREYLEAMWDVFHPRGAFALLLAEHQGTLVSGVLGLGFGDTFYAKLAAWTGDLKELRPNQAAQWCAMRWARNAGYLYYDFEGIDRQTALELSSGESHSEQMDSLTSFKLGFGGTPVVSPTPRSWVDNRLANWAYGHLLNLRGGALMEHGMASWIRVFGS